MARWTQHSFEVSGRGEFPFDMLRYDSCWPATGEDALNMRHTCSHEQRRIKLHCMREGSRPWIICTMGRWGSFGWAVVKIDGEETAR